MANNNLDNRKDILLLMLYSPGTNSEYNVPIVGRTRLVKMLFLFKQEALKQFVEYSKFNSDEYYDFIPWDFGPFSAEVYEDLRFFELRDFLFVKINNEDILSASTEEWFISFLTTNDQEAHNKFSKYEEVSFSLTKKGYNFVERELFMQLSPNQKNLLQYFRRKYESTPLRSILKHVYEKYPEYAKCSKIRNKIKVK